MKILMCSYHNPNFTNTCVYRDRAVTYLGHVLISFDDRKFIIPGRIRDRARPLHAWDLQRINNQLIRQARETTPDICFVIGGQRILPETVRQLKKTVPNVALWTTDAPIDFDNVLAAAPYYDHLFCAGSEAREIFRSKGHTRVSWIPFACDPHFHKPVDLSEEDRKKYGRDIVFVGSYYPNRAETLETIADLDIGVWGPYWHKLSPDSPLRRKVISGKFNHDQWIKIYNAAKIVLVIHYRDPRVNCFQASPKLFEALACKSFVLSDSQEDALTLFGGSHSVAFFRNNVDLRKQLQHYLSHDEKRERTAARGYREALERHTYARRLQEMIDILKGASAS